MSTSPTDPTDLPIDPTSRKWLAADGLTLALLDHDDPAAFAAWTQAEARGFHAEAFTTEQIEQRRTYVSGRRITGVWDGTAADPATPVGTTETWTTELTVPGQRSVPAWAISNVTVAPTHRRRGIARSLLEGELRNAAAAGTPVAMLTVSESTIYHRFGFAPSALARDLTIDTSRVRWTGPEPLGRTHLVSGRQLLDDGLALIERVRLESPGQMAYAGVLWERQLGQMVGDDDARSLRFVRYDDANGTAQGFAIYLVKEVGDDFTHQHLTLRHLVAATADAYAGLWRYLLEMDLVARITAHLRPVDEPLRWMIADFRAIHVDEYDHLWTRILDVPAALEARTYARPGRLVLDISDEWGRDTPGVHTHGRWALEVDESGTASVTQVDEPVDVSVTVNELAAIHLGAASPLALATAGRIVGDARGLEEMFRSTVAPWLSIWF